MKKLRGGGIIDLSYQLCKLANLSDYVMGNNVENTLFLSYLTFKIFLYNMQKDFYLAATAIVFDKILSCNQGLSDFLSYCKLFSSLPEFKICGIDFFKFSQIIRC